MIATIVGSVAAAVIGDRLLDPDFRAWAWAHVLVLVDEQLHPDDSKPHLFIGSGCEGPAPVSAERLLALAQVDRCDRVLVKSGLLLERNLGRWRESECRQRVDIAQDDLDAAYTRLGAAR